MQMSPYFEKKGIESNISTQLYITVYILAGGILRFLKKICKWAQQSVL